MNVQLCCPGDVPENQFLPGAGGQAGVGELHLLQRPWGGGVEGRKIVNPQPRSAASFLQQQPCSDAAGSVEKQLEMKK